jgi:hypothetical protein
VRAGPEDHTAGPVDEDAARTLGPDPSPLAVVEGRTPLLMMDRCEIGTPLGDLEALSPR